MRGINPLLVLLLSMCGAQTPSTQTEVQTESQSTGAADSAQVNIYDELRELRDMVVEMRVLLTVTQNELQNTKAENDAQNIQLTAMMTRLVASETEVGNLRKETALQTADLRSVTERMAATETDMAYVKKDTAAQHTDLTTMKTEVMNLSMANAAQETRLSATESDVVNLEKEITEQPRVAFSAGLTNSGYVIAGNNQELNLVFTKIITNVGQAYSSSTGFFTAPVRGVYYFRFTVMDQLSSRTMWIRMFRGGQQVLYFGEGDTDGNYTYLSGGVTLQLEVGDVVNMRIPSGYRLYDDAANHCTFSGFLLFPLGVSQTFQKDVDKP